MAESFKKVGVLGAGVMGAQLAGHLANAGIPSLLFDLSQDLSEQGIKNLTSLKPAPLFDRNNVELITPRNYGDHIAELGEVDWVLEAVAERLDIKQKVFETVVPQLRDDVVITTNTSGLSVAEIGADLPERLRKRFMLTHFFNPPRYLRLVEVVQSEAHNDVVQAMVDFLENILGKGIVYAKDTPNFIGNRIG
ncbi:MAG: 3-hydroxyacyl-CoA dehydrogenase family protein, partial [Fidelibacterota bacterium]